MSQALETCVQSSDRRRMLVGMAALTAAATPAVAMGSRNSEPSPITALACTYEAAEARWERALAHRARLEDAFDEAREGWSVSCFPGLKLEGYLGDEEILHTVRREYDEARRGIRRLTVADPAAGAQALAAIDAREAVNLAEVERAFADRDAASEEFGLAGAEREADDAALARDKALLALCAASCATMADVRAKFTPLAVHFAGDEAMPGDAVEALIRSFAPADV